MNSRSQLLIWLAFVIVALGLASATQSFAQSTGNQDQPAADPVASQEDASSEPMATQQDTAADPVASQEDAAADPVASQDDAASEPMATQEDPSDPVASQQDAASEPMATQQDEAPKSEKVGTSTEAVAAEPDQDADTPKAPSASKNMTLKELQAVLDQQEKQLEKQNALIARQQKLLDKQQENTRQQRKDLDQQAQLLATLQNDIGQLTSDDTSKTLSEDAVRFRERLQTLESRVAKNDEDPEQLQDSLNFPGSMRIPGTNAAYRIGGFVKMSLVDSLDPIGSDDRFVTSSIPTMPVDKDGEVVVSSRQSRTNFDVREKTSLGIFRAFVEGDFAGDGDTYRLRHAYGQFGPLLTGKTWSTFVDNQASPEEIDFEGISGKINVRQPQVRFFPKIGKDWNLMFSLEDPEIDVQDGEGVSEIPDFVASIRRTLWDDWHFKTSVLLREIQAVSTINPMGKESEIGWGASISGRTSIPWLNDQDLFLFQINYGDGLGRYVNDLGSNGGRDGVFDPSDGSLKTLKTFAGYLSAQHWWSPKMRSNLVYSWVSMNNHSFQPGSDLESTTRATINWLWSPIPRVDLGAEFLWGRRQDRNGNEGIAKQFQVATTYRF